MDWITWTRKRNPCVLNTPTKSYLLLKNGILDTFCRNTNFTAWICQRNRIPCEWFCFFTYEAKVKSGTKIFYRHSRYIFPYNSSNSLAHGENAILCMNEISNIVKSSYNIDIKSVLFHVDVSHTKETKLLLAAIVRAK